jgi:dienelactone hydrolase
MPRLQSLISFRKTVASLGILQVVAFLFTSGLSAEANDSGFSEPGKFPVGVTTTVLVDHGRTDAFTKEPRTLVTEIWYPATDDAGQLPRNRYSDFLPGGVTPEVAQAVQKTYKLPVEQIDKIFWNNAARDARVRPGKFPLVIFSHGNGGNRHQNTFWCDYLASHGYVIVSADHTGNANMTVIDGKPIPYQGTQRMASAIDRPKDMSFLLDQMTRWNQGADSRFAGKLVLDQVCAAGMSFGAMSAVDVAALDARFKSIIAMSGASLTHTNLEVPSLWMLGGEDRTIGPTGNLLIGLHHTAHTGPSFMLELKDGGHYSFTDMFKINKEFGDGVGAGKRRQTQEPFQFTSMEKTYEIVNAYSLAFLEVYARGRSEKLSFLQTNHWPKEVVLKVSGAAGDGPKPKRADAGSPSAAAKP